MTRIIGLSASAGDPAAVPGQVVLYSKDVLGVTKYFARLSDGTIIEIGASSGGGAATNVTYTFRPGASETGPFLWNDFNDLYTALDAARTAAQGAVQFTVVLDDSITSPVVIPIDTFDLTNVKLRGAGTTYNTQAAVSIVNGAILDNAHHFENLSIVSAGPSTPFTYSAAAGVSVYLDRTSVEASTSSAFAVVGTTVAAFLLTNNSSFSTGALNVQDTAQVNVLVDSAGLVNSDSIATAAGTNVQVIATAGSATLYTDQADASPGTVSFSSNTACLLWYMGDPNGVLSAQQGSLLLDSTGSVWRNTDNASAWALFGGGGSSASASNVYTFDPGSGAAGPNKYDDFNALYAAFDAARAAAGGSGKFTIVFDDTGSGGPGNPVVLDSGPGNVTYDFQYATLVGVHQDANVELHIQDGGGETDSLAINNALWFEGLTITGTGQGTPFIAQQDQTISLKRTTFIGGGEYVYDFLGTPGCVLNLDDGSRLQRATNAAIRVNSTTLTIHVDGERAVIDNLGVAGFVGGSIDVIIGSSSARVDKQQDIASQQFTMASAAGFWNGDPNGVLIASQGVVVSDETTGVLWRNTDGATAWAAFSNSVFQWRIGVTWATIYAQMNSVPGPKICLVEYDPATNGDRTVTNNGGSPQDFNNILFVGLAGAPSDGVCPVLVFDDGIQFAAGPEGVRLASQDVGWNFSALTAPAYIATSPTTWTSFNMTGGDLRGSNTPGVAAFDGTLWLLLRDVHANGGNVGRCTDTSDELWLRGGTRVFNPIFIDNGDNNGLAVYADASCQWSAAGLIANGLSISPMEVTNYAKGTGTNLYSISVDGGGNVIATLVP